MRQILTDEMRLEQTRAIEDGLDKVSDGIMRLQRQRDELLTVLRMILDDTDCILPDAITAALEAALLKCKS